MSLIRDGQLYVCNGQKCRESAHTPSSQPLLYLYNEQEAMTELGWLFVESRGRWKHYCPVCAKKMMK